MQFKRGDMVLLNNTIRHFTFPILEALVNKTPCEVVGIDNEGDVAVRIPPWNYSFEPHNLTMHKAAP